MPSTKNIAIAAVAGVVVLGGAAWLAQNKLMFGGIHSVDFRNTPVEVVGTACADPQLTTAGVTKLPLHDGSYQLGQYQFELVGDVSYGDVSGHTGETGSDKAVFVGSCSTAGKTSQVLFVYGMEDGQPARLASSDLSGSANTLVQSYMIGDGAIKIKANQGDPPALVTLSYVLLNGALVNLNPAASSTQTAESAAPADMSAAETPPTDQVAENSSAGDDQVNFESFHNELAPYGQWINHSVWGLVWHPTAVPADFRPYREGHWEDTAEYGTVWVSDYSWGDVPFHYGRWGYDPNDGWLWQPGYTWSPAWVAWREGAGDIGWFPIPPGYYDGTGAFADDWNGWYGYRSLYAGMDAAAFYGLWSFIPADDIYAPSIGIDIVAPGLYAGFIGRTIGWTRFGLLRGHLFNRAIDRDRFRGAFGHPLPASTRHDFLAHHGPIVGVDRGHMIARHEGHSAGVGHGVAAHAGAFERHTSPYGHMSSRSPSTHSFGSSHTYSHTSVTVHSGFGGSTGHSGYGGTESHSGFGGRTESHSSFGGGTQSHSGFGGGASHSSFGGGSSAQHSAFGGGAPAQHSGFGGGAYTQRPAMGGGVGAPASGGAFHPSAASTPRAAPSSSAHHH